MDWWLLHEYGSVLSEAGESETALLLLCKAAISCPKPALAVKLYQELGDAFFALSDKQSALIHYMLARAVRTENDWPITPELQSTVVSIELELGPKEDASSIAKLIGLCRQVWLELLPDSDHHSDLRQPRRGLTGRISIVSGRRACFINCKDGLAAICMDTEIPSNVNDGEIVKFDAVPAFDKKKNRESWRAKNVHKHA